MIKKRLVALLLISLSACATDNQQSGSNIAKLVEFQPIAKFEVRWEKDIGSAGNNVLLPAISSDAIYVANARGKISRLDIVTGNRVWRVDCGFTVAAGVGVGEGLVLIGGEKGDIAAYAEDGKLRWQAKVSSEVLSAPQISNGIVVVRTADGRIAGLSADDGKRLWVYERSTPALVVRNHAGVAIKREMLFAGLPGGKLAAIALGNGIVAWESIVSIPRGNTELEQISDVTSVPVVDEEQVCAVSFQGRLACFDSTQGNLLWGQELSSDVGLVLFGNLIYVTDEKGGVSALNKTTGNSVWKNDQLAMRQPTAPFILGPYVVVGDYEGYLHALKSGDGSFGARIATDGSSIKAMPVELDGGLLVQTSNGRLYSIALR